MYLDRLARLRATRQQAADAIAIGAIVIIAGNVGELAVVFTAALASLPAPLLPLHLLDQTGSGRILGLNANDTWRVDQRATRRRR